MNILEDLVSNLFLWLLWAGVILALGVLVVNLGYFLTKVTRKHQKQ